MNNPHIPTDSWLKALSGKGGYDADPDLGDCGSMIVKRPSGSYEVTVEKVDE